MLNVYTCMSIALIVTAFENTLYKVYTACPFPTSFKVFEPNWNYLLHKYFLWNLRQVTTLLMFNVKTKSIIICAIHYSKKAILNSVLNCVCVFFLSLKFDFHYIKSNNVFEIRTSCKCGYIDVWRMCRWVSVVNFVLPR